MSKNKTDPTFDQRRELQNNILNGQMSLGKSIRALRKQIRLTQPEFAKLVGIYPRVLLEIENDNGNPTLETLNKVLDKFGFEIGIVRKRKNLIEQPLAPALPPMNPSR